MLKVGIEALQRWVTPGALTDPDVFLYAARVSVWGRWFVWLVGVFLLAYRPGFWYPDDIEFLAPTCAAGGLQRPCAPSAPDEQAGDVALDALPQRHGTCPDHLRHRHRRRIQELHLPGLLSVPRRFRRGLLVPFAQPRVDDDGRRCVRCRVLAGGLRSRPRCGQREGAAGQGWRCCTPSRWASVSSPGSNASGGRLR